MVLLVVKGISGSPVPLFYIDLASYKHLKHNLDNKLLIFVKKIFLLTLFVNGFTGRSKGYVTRGRKVTHYIKIESLINKRK